MSPFRNLCITETGLETATELEGATKSRPIANSAREALALASRAVDLYSGFFRQLPEHKALYWFNSYHARDAKHSELDCAIPRQLVPGEIKYKAALLTKVPEAGRAYPVGMWAFLHCRDEPMSNRSRVQFAAVETLLHVDSLLTSVRHRRSVAQSLVWLSAAHEAYSYGISCAQSMYGWPDKAPWWYYDVVGIGSYWPLTRCSG